jgi:Domain of unknown function (DUF4386)
MPPEPLEKTVRLAQRGPSERGEGDTMKTAVLLEPTAATRSTRKFSLLAGVGLLVMSALSAFGYLIAVKGHFTPGNPSRTAKQIMGSEGTFQLGVFSLFLVAALDVVVGWALYQVFRPVSERLSMLAALLRTAYAVAFVFGIIQLVGLTNLVNTQSAAHSQALQRIDRFTNIWDAGLVLFGISLLLVAYLVYRSSYAPNLLGVLVAIAGFGYLVDSFSRLHSRSSSLDISAITGIGEFVFALWLVIRGRRITLSE